jgi:hypothetical protein
MAEPFAADFRGGMSENLRVRVPGLQRRDGDCFVS